MEMVMTKKTAEKRDSVDLKEKNKNKEKGEPSSKSARKMKMRSRKRFRSASGRVPPALTASKTSELIDEADDECREKSRERAKKRQKLRDKRERAKVKKRRAKAADKKKNSADPDDNSEKPEKVKTKRKEKATKHSNKSDDASKNKEESVKKSKKKADKKAEKKIILDSDEVQQPAVAPNTDEDAEAGEQEDASKRGGRKSMRLKRKAKAKKRKKKNDVSVAGGEQGSGSDQSVDSGSEIEEITAKETQAKDKDKNAPAKKYKALGDRHIAPDSKELDCSEFHEIDDTKMAVAGVTITLDRPAIAKKDAEKRREQKEKEKPKEKAKTDGKKAKRGKVQIEEIDDLDEEEINAGKTADRKKKKSEKARDNGADDDEIEELDNSDDIEEIDKKKNRRDKKKAADRKKINSDDIEEIDDLDSVEEVSKRSKKQDKKDKKDKKDVKAGASFEVDDDEIERVEKKSSKDKKDKESKDKKERRGAKYATSLNKNKNQPRHKDERPVQKNTNFMPVAAIGSILGILVLSLVFVINSENSGSKLNANKKAARAEQLDTDITNAINFASTNFDTKYAESIEKLRVLERLTKAAKKREIAKEIRKLKKNHLARAQQEYDALASKAQDYMKKGDIELALKTLDRFSPQFRDTEVWQEEAIPMINRAVKAQLAEIEGRPLIKAAQRLHANGKTDRALGLLAGFSEEHKNTSVGEKLRELREAIKSQLLRKKIAEEKIAEKDVIRKGNNNRVATAQSKVETLRNRAKDPKYPWIRQTGKNLFTWQIRKDFNKGQRIFKLQQRTLSINNNSGETQVLAKNKNDWYSFVVKFKVKLIRGRWSFLGKARQAYQGRRKVRFMDRLAPELEKGRWVDIEIYAIRDQYFQVIDGGEWQTLKIEDPGSREVGGFGFMVLTGTIIQFKDIEAKVLERKRIN
jgi:hypothetical protein